MVECWKRFQRLGLLVLSRARAMWADNPQWKQWSRKMSGTMLSSKATYSSCGWRNGKSVEGNPRRVVGVGVEARMFHPVWLTPSYWSCRKKSSQGCWERGSCWFPSTNNRLVNLEKIQGSWNPPQTPDLINIISWDSNPPLKFWKAWPAASARLTEIALDSFNQWY